MRPLGEHSTFECLVFIHRVSLESLGELGIHYKGQACLTLMVILLTHAHECWEFWQALSTEVIDVVTEFLFSYPLKL